MASNKKLALGLSAAGLALVTGLGVTSVAYAATTPSPTPSASASTDASTDGRAGLGGHGHRGGGKGVQAAALASKLGVDEAKVTEALKAFRDANKPAAASGSGSETPAEKPDRAAMESALAASLAQSLGIDEAKVTAALEEIRTEAQAERAAALKTRLDKAVSDGTLTQAEADGAAKAVEKGVIGGGR